MSTTNDSEIENVNKEVYFIKYRMRRGEPINFKFYNKMLQLYDVQRGVNSP